MAVPANEPMLLKQYKLLGAVIDSLWATRLDHKVARVVIDRYFAKHGNARASLRYLEVATGATRTNIIASTRRLIEQGVIDVTRKGLGTRPTEYGPIFSFAEVIANPQKPFANYNNLQPALSSGPTSDTSNSPSGPSYGTSSKQLSGLVGDTATSGPVGNTSCGLVDDTSSASRGTVGDTESYLRNTLTSVLTVSRNEDAHAVPTAPPVSGLKADPAETALDPEKMAGGFEELWAAYPRKHHRTKARTAYEDLAPDADLHAKLVGRALAWSEHYSAHGTEQKWRKHLHSWLAEERYLEDLPEPYENPKEAAIAKKKERGPNKPTEPSKAREVGLGLSDKTPQGEHSVVIVGSDLSESVGSPDRRLQFSYRIQGGQHDGREFSHTFKYFSEDHNEQERGQLTFAGIRSAVGLVEVEDTSELHNLSLRAIVAPMGRISYAAL